MITGVLITLFAPGLKIIGVKRVWESEFLVISASSLLIAACIGEFIARQQQYLKTYYEQNGLAWVSPYNEPNPKDKWFHRWTPNTENIIERPEFNYPKTSNSLGILDMEHPKDKPAGEFRIVALGDSFTEGMGVPMDSTWPRLLQYKLNALDTSLTYRSINGGVSGSDPLYNFVMFKEQLKDYNPDLVIAVVNNSDINDIIIRGGVERFHADSSVTFNKGPWYEPFYQHSFLFRMYIHKVLNKDYLYLSPKEREAQVVQAIEKIKSCYLDLQKWCTKRNIKLLIVCNPMRDEVENNFVPLGQMLEQLEAEKLHTLNLLPIVKGTRTPAEILALYWPIDGHFNLQGYDLMAGAILSSLKAKQLVPVHAGR
jgi:lysophospholipase L1-like esterase